MGSPTLAPHLVAVGELVSPAQVMPETVRRGISFLVPNQQWEQGDDPTAMRPTAQTD